jgi:hypothetical protein
VARNPGVDVEVTTVLGFRDAGLCFTQTLELLQFGRSGARK